MMKYLQNRPKLFLTDFKKGGSSQLFGIYHVIYDVYLYVVWAVQCTYPNLISELVNLHSCMLYDITMMM